MQSIFIMYWLAYVKHFAFQSLQGWSECLLFSLLST